LEVAAVAVGVGGRKFIPFEGDRIMRIMLAKAGEGESDETNSRVVLSSKRQRSR